MFKALNRLKNLLTPANLQFLDKILSSLLNPESPGFQDFWTNFQDQFKEGGKAYQQAYIALKDLKDILMEYRKNQ